MAPKTQPSRAAGNLKLAFDADAIAIFIALGLAALVRLNIIHRIAW